MTDLHRVKKVINWLIFSEFAENEKDIAEKLGYTKSSFSQIINGKVPLSDRFLDKICKVDKNINKVWLKIGEGEMLKGNQNITNESNNNINSNIAGGVNGNVTISHNEVSDMIELQKELNERLKTSQNHLSESQSQLSESQKQINELIKIISKN
jgi:transcriptional regulator with XRE-family HTH domain